ncbi:MAG TPA: hypothetical protein VMI94_19335 [Bryobacteraceae bacterium]|nr:hypothetical protein [Bryobacteraceae bacterium]
MSRKALLAMIVCGLMAVLLQPTSAVAAPPSLAGSWQLTFTPATPPTPPVVAVPGLATFTSDGSVIETDGTQLAPGVPASNGVPTYGSPGHGIWQLLPSMTGYYISYVSLSVNADGSLSSRSVTVATVGVVTSTNGTTLSGTYTTTTSGPAGMPPKITTGKLTGQLIPHPPLP